MKSKHIIMGLILVSAMVLMPSCGPSSVGDGRIPVVSSEEELAEDRDLEQPSEQQSESRENSDGASDEREAADLETIAELLGKTDFQAAEAFDGGEENWTEDNTLFIGRIYQVSLFDEEVSVFTSYDENQLVNSVSVWLANGEYKVKEGDVMQWVERLNEFTGTKPYIHGVVSEAGSKNWKWFLDDWAVTLNWLEDMLTISMNVVVGELE